MQLTLPLYPTIQPGDAVVLFWHPDRLLGRVVAVEGELLIVRLDDAPKVPFGIVSSSVRKV